jgi:osmotically-inducible protein OsmY
MKLALPFAIGALALVAACDDKKNDTNTTQTTSANVAGDNTKRNEVDRNANTVTPLDQSNAAADLAVTQKIRQEVMADDNLSSNAKNAKIITTAGGQVTLRGAVDTAAEKAALEAHATKIAGANKVKNELTLAAP